MRTEKTVTIATVTYSNLASQSWQNIYDVINNRTNVPDPYSSAYRKFVYTRDPDVKNAGFAGYPYIIVNDPEFSESGQRTTDGKSAFIEFSAEIEIVSSERGYGNEDGKGSQYIKTIADDILATLNDPTIRNTFMNTGGMLMSRPRATSASVEPLHDTLVWRKSIFVSFKAKRPMHA